MYERWCISAFRNLMNEHGKYCFNSKTLIGDFEYRVKVL